jgi:hypothetical protein
MKLHTLGTYVAQTIPNQLPHMYIGHEAAYQNTKLYTRVGLRIKTYVFFRYYIQFIKNVRHPYVTGFPDWAINLYIGHF